MNFFCFLYFLMHFHSTHSMYSKDLQEKVWEARQRGCSWNELERNFGIARSSCRDLVKTYGTPVKPRPKNHCKVKGNVKKRLLLAVKALTDENARITATKLMDKSHVNLSVSTVQRFLKSEGLKYINPEKVIILSTEHKARRHEICKKWLVTGAASKNIIFTDEVPFRLDGPDNIKSWQAPKKRQQRAMRQQGGGSILFWGMLFSTGQLHLHEIKGNLDSKKYCQLLNSFALPLIHAEYLDEFILQQDNAPPHASEYTQRFLEEKGVDIMEWPARSPDLNVIENCWHILKMKVYESSGAKNIPELREKVAVAVQQFNETPETGKNIYMSFGKRALQCYEGQGNLLSSYEKTVLCGFN